MARLHIPGGELDYDESGAGETLVMLPSGAHSRHDYDELRALLGAGVRTVAIDWPAHGRSPASASTSSAMHLADVAEQAVGELAPAGAVVIGNSVGGFAAARLALRRPELVRALVLVDAGGFAPRSAHVRAFCALMARPRFLRAVYPTFSWLYMRPRTDADRRARAAAIATTRADPGLRAVSELWGSFSSPEHDLRSRAHEIAAPTLVVWGRRDPVISARVGRRVASTIPGARLELLDTGHLPHTSAPERFAELLRTFLEELPALSAGSRSQCSRVPSASGRPR